MTEKQLGDPPAGPRNRFREDPEVSDSGGAVWGWVAGLAVLTLIVFVLVGGWNGSGQ